MASMLKDLPDIFDIFETQCKQEDVYTFVLIFTFWPIYCVIGIICGIIIGLKYLIKALVWYFKNLFGSLNNLVQKKK